MSTVGPFAVLRMVEIEMIKNNGIFIERYKIIKLIIYNQNTMLIYIMYIYVSRCIFQFVGNIPQFLQTSKVSEKFLK